MTYKDRLIAALETRRDVYAADSNIDRMRYMAEGLDAAITIARATRPDVGTWVGIDDFPHEDWECDNCGCVVGNTDDPWNYWHFCPNCGADMRGENNG